MQFRWHNIADASSEFIERWQDLGHTASSPNIYVMPDFMLPAIRHLEVEKSPQFAVVWNADHSAMLALVAFDVVPPSWRFPYWRLSAFRSKHSFQTGGLLRSGSERQALDCLFDHLLDGPSRAFRFNDLREDTVFHQQLRAAASRRGLRWFIHGRYERANLIVSNGPRWRSYVSDSRHKKLQDARARLGRLGTVETRTVLGDEISDATIEHFLRLESLGWKAETSLLAIQEGGAFFREVAESCRSQRTIFFCELLLNGEVIASTANFYLGDLGFAFKVGMNPAYAKFSPGYLLEYGFLEACENVDFPFREIESGAQADSFIEALWPGRVNMVSGHFVSGALPSLYTASKEALKRTRRRLKTARTTMGFF